jgi:hypothetical protein
MELVGHSGTHAPQAMQSSLIVMDMGYYSLVKFTFVPLKVIHAHKLVK